MMFVFVCIQMKTKRRIGHEFEVIDIKWHKRCCCTHVSFSFTFVCYFHRVIYVPGLVFRYILGKMVSQFVILLIKPSLRKIICIYLDF